MVRIRRFAAALALTVLATAGHASAQTLQRLTVQSFSLVADNPRPQIEVPFHLIVTLRVRERVLGIDNLELPILAELELQGDERRVESDASGTSYRETITVVAHHSGDIAIAPATLQAIDARDGKPKQYSTNPLTVHVEGGALEPLSQGESFASQLLQIVGRAVLWTFGILCAIAVAFLLFRRRPVPNVSAPAPVPVAYVAPTPAPAPRSDRDRLQDALTVLRAERNRAAAVRVRSMVWEMIGANDGETLADVLTRPQAGNPGMRELLRSLERAAFTYDRDVPAAIDAACNALERYIA